MCSRTDVPGRRAVLAVVHRADPAAPARPHPRLERALRARRVRARLRHSDPAHAAEPDQRPRHGRAGHGGRRAGRLPRLPGGAVRHRLRAGERRPQRRRVAAAACWAGSPCRCCARPCSTRRCWSSRSPSNRWAFPWCSAPPRATTSSPATCTTPGQAGSPRTRPSSAPGRRSCSPSRACCCCCAAGCSATRPASCRSAAGAATAGGVQLGTWLQLGARRAPRLVPRGHHVRPDRGAGLVLGRLRADSADRALAPAHARQLADDRHTGTFAHSILNTVEIAAGRRRGHHRWSSRWPRPWRTGRDSGCAAPCRSCMLFPRAIPGIIIGIGFFWTFLLVNPPGERAAQQHLGDHAGAQRPLAHDSRIS